MKIEYLLVFIIILNFNFIKCENLSTTIFEALDSLLGSTHEGDKVIPTVIQQPNTIPAQQTNAPINNNGQTQQNQNNQQIVQQLPNQPIIQQSESAQAQKQVDNSMMQESSLPNQKNKLNKDKIILDLNNPANELSAWMSIKSIAFTDTKKYPHLLSNENNRLLINLSNFQRKNDNFPNAKLDGALNDSSFWFRIRGGYIYYSATKSDMNILDAIFAKSIQNSINISDNSDQQECFTITDFNNYNYDVCSNSKAIKITWMCSLQKFLKINLDNSCNPEPKTTQIASDSNINVKLRDGIIKRKVLQNVIIIPTPSKKCNDNWNYNNRGTDWECGCKEGRMQSPINLPSEENSIPTKLKPVFEYERVTVDQTDIINEEKAKIKYHNGAIRITHPNMGKIINAQGSIFQAEEISFHTPSEHTINGVKYDMEMQILHTGRTKNDISKQVILSFLFKTKPGVYNKLIERLDFFNLPNQIDRIKDLTQGFFIPHVLFTTDDDDVPSMEPFSFYTYEGSLTSPPCSERTTHYVAADILPLSNTILALFKEALKKPDSLNKDDAIDLILDEDGEINNAREIQPLNNRTVYFYNPDKNGCIRYQPKKKEIKKIGHYEKRTVDTTNYVYYTGEANKIPGALIVDEKEALAHSPILLDS